MLKKLLKFLKFRLQGKWKTSKNDSHLGEKCVHCGEIVEDWEPRYCCNGEACGCYGLPIDPPEHEICVAIAMLERLKKVHEENKDLGFSYQMKFGETTEISLYCGRKVISNDDISREEIEYIMEAMGMVHCIADWSDYIIKKLKG